MSRDDSVKLISPSAVLERVAKAIPEDFRPNIIIIGYRGTVGSRMTNTSVKRTCSQRLTRASSK